MRCPDWSCKLKKLLPYWLLFNIPSQFEVRGFLKNPMPLHDNSSGMCHLGSIFLVAEAPSKQTPHFVCAKRWNRFLPIFIVRLALYVCLKIIGDCMGSSNSSIHTTHTPPPLSFYNTLGIVKWPGRGGVSGMNRTVMTSRTIADDF